MAWIHGIQLAAAALMLLLMPGPGRAADPSDVERRVQALADRLYPGELVVRVGGQDFLDDGVTPAILLTSRREPFAGIRLDRSYYQDRCLGGSGCEADFQATYRHYIERGQMARLLAETFTQCGVPLIEISNIYWRSGLHGIDVTGGPLAYVWVRQPIDNASRAVVTGRLIACVRPWLYRVATARMRVVVGLLPSADVPNTPVIGWLARPTRLIDPSYPDRRHPFAARPYYALIVGHGTDPATPPELRLELPIAERQALEARIRDEVDRYLGRQPSLAQARVAYGVSWTRDASIAGGDLNTFHLRIPACSVPPAGSDCTERVPVSLTYDRRRDTLSDFRLVRQTTGAGGERRR